MNERVIVDFSRVDAALDHTSRVYEIAADRQSMTVARERSEIAAKMIKYGAAACAAIIVSIGVAIWLARQQHVTRAEASPALAHLPYTAVPSNAAPTRIMTKVVLFNSIEGGALRFTNLNIVDLVAGHQYSNSNSERWENAWCYASFRQSGVRYRVDLASRTQGKLTPQPASQEEMHLLGLSEADVSSLRQRCPWREQ
jgi:hypothetical protein